MFDFTKTDDEYLYNIILHITQMNHSVVMLYFTDEMNNNINIPDGIVVYT